MAIDFIQSKFTLPIFSTYKGFISVLQFKYLVLPSHLPQPFAQNKAGKIHEREKFAESNLNIFMHEFISGKREKKTMFTLMYYN